MENSKNNIGAISALKGYRVQFLYTLLRILSYSESENEFHPEGNFEDLDIYNSNSEIIEIIQVKNLTEILTLSKILSSKEKNSFLQRALKVYKEGKRPKIKLVSFGDINDDVKNLNQKKYSPNLLKKLKAQGLNDTEIKILQDNFEYEIVGEQKVIENIFSSIEKWGSFANIKITLDLLTYWIYFAAEKQDVITPANFKEQFDRVCSFQKERINFNSAYNSLIRQLDNEIETEDLEHLKSDFYKGISATYKHILANVDVIRLEKLNSIKERFRESNIVFIHGASGQGKSTLAYRYLNENCSLTTVFELSHLPEDVSVIYKVINSLEGISKGIRFPITIYIDVEPGNKEWINILEILASKKNFNFLVTIREEDWNSIEVGDKFSFAEVELLFEKKEAELIYAALDKYNKDLRFTDFENAWDTFGGSGPLLEFVYLITQNESLSAKLKSQINNIRKEASDSSNEKIKILRYVVLADCFSSKIKLKEFNQFLKLKNDILFLIDLLKKEYLIKTAQDNTYITGLHPVRSEIIKEILFDNEIDIESVYALDAITFISDYSILNFLRNAFRYSNLDPNKLIEQLKNFSPAKWQSYLLILRSLLWKGIDDYIKRNIDLLNKIYADYNQGWILVVDFDFTNTITGGSTIEGLEIFSKEQRQYAQKINEELSDKKEILTYCFNWLRSLKKIDLIPDSKDEWDAFGLFLFWLNYLNISDVNINFEKLFSYEVIRNQPIEVLAHVLYAFKKYNLQSLLYKEKVEEIFLKKLSKTFNVISIEQKDDSINCYFLFDIINEEIDKEESDFVHAKSMKIINILRFAFPDKETYGTKGIGHHFSFLPNDHDSSINRIPQNNLPLFPLVEINSTYLNLFNYTKRPSMWHKYVTNIINRRQLLAEVLQKMVTAFNSSHKQKNLQPLAEYIQDYTENYHKIIINSSSIPLLPKIIIDEWGLHSEGSARKIKSKFEQYDESNEIKERIQMLAVKKYDNFLGLYREIDNAISNFSSQSFESIFRKIKIFLKEDVSKIPDAGKIPIINLFKAYEFIEEFQKSFRVHFEKFVDSKLLKELEKDECDNISILCFLYNKFISKDNFLTGNVNKIALHSLTQMEISIKRKISNVFKQLAKQYGYYLTFEFDEINKRCIIIIDVDESLQSLKILEIIYNKLFEIISQWEYTSINYLIINKKYPVLYLIPLVSGKSINYKWFEFKVYNIREKKFDELEQFNLIPYDIPIDVAEKHKIEAWNRILINFNNLDKLLESSASLNLLAFHFSQLKYFENKEIAEYNEEILRKHIEKIGKLFQEHFQSTLDIFTNFMNLYNEKKIEFKDENEKLEFGQFLIDCHRNFYPNDELFEKSELKFDLGTKEVDTWIPRLKELTNNISIIYYFLADKIIKGKLKKY